MKLVLDTGSHELDPRQPVQVVRVSRRHPLCGKTLPVEMDAGWVTVSFRAVQPGGPPPPDRRGYLGRASADES
jgi:hypothetical protein